VDVPSDKPFVMVIRKACVGSTAGERCEKYVRGYSGRWNWKRRKAITIRKRKIDKSRYEVQKQGTGT
jgi:hypothetical protein